MGMPSTYNPALLSHHQLVMDCVDFKDQLDVLNARWSEAFEAWRNSIRRADPQEVLDAHENAYKSIKRRTSWINNKLFKARKERINRDLNSLRELVQDAQKLRATQGENAGGP